MGQELVRNIKAFIGNPRTAFHDVRDEPAFPALAYFGLLFILYLIMSFVVFAVGTLFLPIGPPADLPVLFIPHVLLQMLPLMLLPFYLVLLHGWVYALGGRRGFSQTVKPVLYGLTPLLLLGYFEFLFIIAGLWSLGLIALGLTELQGMSLGKAGLATLLPSIFLVVLIFILFLAAL